MTTLAESLGVNRLSVEQRMALAEELWASVIADSKFAPPTLAQRQELERRIADDDAKPDDLVLWETVKAEAQARLGR